MSLRSTPRVSLLSLLGLHLLCFSTVVARVKPQVGFTHRYSFSTMSAGQDATKIPECSIDFTCSRHGRCLGDGSCQCLTGWSGADCNTADGGGDPCAKDMYAEGCTAECSIDSTCSRHGRCLGGGSCQCLDGWSGADCNRTDGEGDPCAKDMYAEGCTAECSIDSTCSRHGRCLGAGSCQCLIGRSGEDCSTTDEVSTSELEESAGTTSNESTSSSTNVEVTPQPSALSPQPLTLSPQPSALNPQPSALNPQSSTLSPQPSVLNPQPSALNPRPQP